MKILVTGAAGFIGMHLSLKLLELGHTVVGIDNINDYYDVNLKYARLRKLGMPTYIYEEDFHNGNFSFFKIDITNNERLKQLFENNAFDTVCNLAAQAGVRYSITHPESYIQSNLVGFYNILEACRNYHIEHLVYASSSSVYGCNTKVPYSINDKTDSPVSLYAATKKAAELLAYSYTHLYGFKATGLRLFTVYGPWGRPDMAPCIFTDAILHDRTIQVFNNGNMSRDFTYIDDIIDGIVSAINTPPTIQNHRVFNLGDNDPVNLLDFISYIEKHTGKKAKKELLPMQNGDVERTYADITESSKELHYIPKVNLDEGIKRFVEWLMNVKNV